MLRRSRSDILH